MFRRSDEVAELQSAIMRYARTLTAGSSAETTSTVRFKFENPQSPRCKLLGWTLELRISSGTDEQTKRMS